MTKLILPRGAGQIVDAHGRPIQSEPRKPPPPSKREVAAMQAALSKTLGHCRCETLLPMYRTITPPTAKVFLEVERQVDSVVDGVPVKVTTGEKQRMVVGLMPLDPKKGPGLALMRSQTQLGMPRCAHCMGRATPECPGWLPPATVAESPPAVVAA